MRTITLTQGRKALVDDSDYARVSEYKWYYSNTGYAYHGTCKKGKRETLLMHRFILNAPKNKYVDHINHDTLDNRRCNIRICSHQQNASNVLPHRRAISRFKGVGLRKDISVNKWQARIYVRGTHKSIGFFKTEIEAAVAYNKEAAKMFGRFAWLNIIPKEYSFDRNPTNK